MGRSRYVITQADQPHFITITVLNWLPVFTRIDTVNILIDSMKFLSLEGLKIYAYVILENHLHMIVQSQHLDKDIQRFKRHTANQLLKYLMDNNVQTLLDQFVFYKKAHKTDRKYQFWQEGVHPELIQHQDMMNQKIDYIHQNPVKRGYVDEAEHWRYSSARSYMGKEGLIEITKEW